MPREKTASGSAAAAAGPAARKQPAKRAPEADKPDPIPKKNKKAGAEAVAPAPAAAAGAPAAGGSPKKAKTESTKKKKPKADLRGIARSQRVEQLNKNHPSKGQHAGVDRLLSKIKEACFEDEVRFQDAAREAVTEMTKELVCSVLARAHSDGLVYGVKQPTSEAICAAAENMYGIYVDPVSN
jgi:hypothetical protein